jgi:hypothetical protein
MSIVIDQFQINTAKPIENRIVVGGTSFYQTKDMIEYKYPGLRTWDLTVNLPYYWTGSEWLNENSTSVSFDTTVDIGYLPKFTTTKSTLGKSIIYENGNVNGNIGIGLVGNNIAPSNAFSAPTKGLHVSGNIRTDNNFLGNGQYITDLNASSITSGSLGIARITGAAANNRYALQSVAGLPTWVLVEAVSTNSASTDSVKIVNDDTSGSSNYLTFVSSTSNYNTLKVSQAKINYIPATGQILLSNGSVGSPAYSFISAANTGIYFAGGAVSTSISGAEITRTDANGLSVVNGTLYLPVSTANNARSPLGISWAVNGNYGINDGFYASGSWITQYGLGAYSPDNNGTIGTYVSGYYGIELFTGGKSKVKVDGGNSTTINTILTTVQSEVLGSGAGNRIVLNNTVSYAGAGNPSTTAPVITTFGVRTADGGYDWTTWKTHDGISFGPSYTIPNASSNGTLTYWERMPYLREQYFGSGSTRTVTINSSTSPFVTIESNLNAKNSLTVTSDVTIASLASGGIRPIGVDNGGKIVPITTSSGVSFASYALTTWAKDRMYSITVSVPGATSILSATARLQCKVANNNYGVGDIITAPTPYPTDSGRTAEQGISVAYWGASSVLYVMITDGVWALWTTNSGTVDTFSVDPAKWNIRVEVFYSK